MSNYFDHLLLLLLLLLLGRSDHDTSSAALHCVAGPRRPNAANFPAGFPPEIPQLRRRVVGGPRHHPLQRGRRSHGDVHCAGLLTGAGKGRGSRRRGPLRTSDEARSHQHDSDAGLPPVYCLRLINKKQNTPFNGLFLVGGSVA